MALFYCGDPSRLHSSSPSECVDCGRRREQRRYEIARDVMAAGFADPDYEAVWEARAKESVAGADALLAALEAK